MAIKLKGHETFALREGWLNKGLAKVDANPKVFSENYGADALGVGSNMAKAIRYWLKAGKFMEEPPKKYFRLFPGNEVRLMNAYFVKCVDFEKDENGKVTVVHCTYDPITKNGTGFTGRKVKGTIHWVSASEGKQVQVRLYENIVDEEKGVYNEEDGSINVNPHSLTVIDNCYVEPELMNAAKEEKFQFVRNGYFCVDIKDSEAGKPVFNRIVSLKSSFKLPK